MSDYNVTIRWKEGLRAEAVPEGVDLSVPFSVPEEFGGPGGEWTPEHFFAAAINACIGTTFLSIARQSKLSFASYESSATAVMEKTEKGLRMTRVDVRPRIRVASEADRDRAQRIIQKAESLCPISRSVTAEVRMEAEVEAGG